MTITKLGSLKLLFSHDLPCCWKWRTSVRSRMDWETETAENTGLCSFLLMIKCKVFSIPRCQQIKLRKQTPLACFSPGIWKYNIEPNFQQFFYQIIYLKADSRRYFMITQVNLQDFKLRPTSRECFAQSVLDRSICFPIYYIKFHWFFSIKTSVFFICIFSNCI